MNDWYGPQFVKLIVWNSWNDPILYITPRQLWASGNRSHTGSWQDDSDMGHVPTMTKLHNDTHADVLNNTICTATRDRTS